MSDYEFRMKIDKVAKKWIHWNEGAAVMFVVSGVVLALLFAFGDV